MRRPHNEPGGCHMIRPTASNLNGKTFDFLVIGAGITGAGVAQDAASRGYSTLLIDKGDFASGTSSKSTKLIHGGLRYLANLQVQVTRESLSERRLQQQLAPHMVWSLPFVIPCYRGSFFKNLKLKLGLFAYDLLAGFSNKTRHKTISPGEVLAHCPGISRAGLVGGLLYYDCRTDDARHVLEVILSAVQFGGRAANYMSMQRALKDASGKLIGAVLKDELSGETLTVYARQIVNATGVWSQATCKAAQSHFNGELLPSKGVHIALKRERLPVDSAVIIPSVHDDRFLFAVPWYDQVIVGTTDSGYKGDLDNPRVEPDEELYILSAVNRLFPYLRLTSKDVCGRYAGLRPLVKKVGVQKTADLSRQHSLELSPERLLSISGGKLTTYRLMAKETVDLAQNQILKSLPGRKPVSCWTENLILGGFNAGESVESFKRSFERKALALGLSAETAAYLTLVYGKRAEQVLDLVERDPHLAEPLVAGHPYILAQVLYAVRYEAAQSLGDVLSRRIRLSILDTNAAAVAADKAYALIAYELGWKDNEKESRLRSFRQEME